jgi:hypothetical protein
MNWAQFIRDAAIVSTAYNTYQTSQKLDTLNSSLDDFKNQTSAELSKLTETVNKGFSMLSLELAVQSQIFKNILTVLKEKRKTEAEELKNFGLKALRNGWINDAIDDFKKSLELNRYDYQVYYLLSKCYFILENKEEQDHFLQMAFQYSSEDSLFRQYIGLDIVGQLVAERKFEEAKEIVKYLEGLLEGEIELTPLLMCDIYIDVFSHNITELTLEKVDKAIDNYEGDDPSRIFTVIKALIHFVTDNQKIKIDNRLNLKKYAITKKYGSGIFTYLDNIEKILVFIYTKADSSSILKLAPKSVIKRYFPLFDDVPGIVDRIRDFKKQISTITIDDYEKFQFIAPLIKQAENSILNDVRKVYTKNEEGNFNSNPFEQNFTPELDFEVGKEDKILVQCKLNEKELITLTYFQLIIVDKDKNVFNYDLIDDFLNVKKDEIRTDEIKAGNRLTDKITFYLRDELSDKILLFSSSSYYTESFGSNEKYANILNLLWSRAVNNILIYLNFNNFNNNLLLLKTCLDFMGIESHVDNTAEVKKDTIDLEFIDDNTSNVEFID